MTAGRQTTRQVGGARCNVEGTLNQLPRTDRTAPHMQLVVHKDGDSESFVAKGPDCAQELVTEDGLLARTNRQILTCISQQHSSADLLPTLQLSKKPLAHTPERHNCPRVQGNLACPRQAACSNLPHMPHQVGISHDHRRAAGTVSQFADPQPSSPRPPTATTTTTTTITTTTIITTTTTTTTTAPSPALSGSGCTSPKSATNG
ncbi:unnamed protein product [Polarella glacialis]|uniref:Uncharacterized protein n=1 Tax=Polarella glacialis TaxID=89957 RepID=A0A813EVG1_POLGL|nr:unnamed protein product [Polarella glacialis]